MLMLSGGSLMRMGRKGPNLDRDRLFSLQCALKSDEGLELKAQTPDDDLGMKRHRAEAQKQARIICASQVWRTTRLKITAQSLEGSPFVVADPVTASPKSVSFSSLGKLMRICEFN